MANKIQDLLGRVVALREARDLVEARRLCVKYLRKNGHNRQFEMELGIVNAMLGLNDQAIECFTRLVKRYPGNAAAHYNLGKTYAIQGYFEQAIRCFEKAIKEDADYREAWMNLAITNRDYGNFDGAADYCRYIIKRWPDYGKAYQVLSVVKHFDSIDEDVELLKKGLSIERVSAESQACIQYALTKVYDDLGQYDLSFSYLDQANALMRRGINYDVAKDERLFESMAKLFTQDYFSSASVNKGGGHHAIFIVGMPRSGTTLVEQILACHSNVTAMGELDYLRSAVWGVNKKMMGTAFPANVLTLDPEDLKNIANWYLGRIKVEQGQYFTDKLPLNFLLIGMIRLLFPEAKIIHCRRDPIDTCLACYRQYFSGSLNFTYSLNELGRYWLAYDKLMRHWHQVLPGFVYDVHYEALVTDMDGEVLKLLQFCGLDWEAQCLQPHKAKRSIRTASVTQVRQPVYQSSIAKWRRYEAHLGPLFDVIGQPS